MQVSNLKNCSLISNQNNVIQLTNDTGIISFTVDFTEKPNSLKVVVSPWQPALEGFSVDDQEFNFDSNLASFEFKNGNLEIVFQSQGLSQLKSGSEVKLIDYYR